MTEIPESSITIDRDEVGEHTHLVDPGDEILVGIGGDPAPPIPRLASYVLPAIDLANGNRPPLVLATSLRGAIHLNADTPAEREQIEFNTKEKLRFLTEFIERFFPDVFSSVEVFGAEALTDSVLNNHDGVTALWAKLAERFPHIADIPSGLAHSLKIPPELVGIKSVPYCALHAVWFQELVDTALADKHSGTSVSVGGQQEAPFNAVRHAFQSADIQEVSGHIGTDVTPHDTRRIIVKSPHCAPVPYAGSLSKKKGKKHVNVEPTAAEDRTRDPFELESGGGRARAGVDADLAYLQNILVRRHGEAAIRDFNDFWHTFCTGYKERVHALTT